MNSIIYIYIQCGNYPVTIIIYNDKNIYNFIKLLCNYSIILNSLLPHVERETNIVAHGKFVNFHSPNMDMKKIKLAWNKSTTHTLQHVSIYHYVIRSLLTLKNYFCLAYILFCNYINSIMYYFVQLIQMIGKANTLH